MEFHRIAKMSDVFNQCLRYSDYFPHAALDERNFSITSLHTISPMESKMIHLLAVTASGHRLYFSHLREYEWNSVAVSPEGKKFAPSCLTLQMLRPPLSPRSAAMGHFNGVGGSQIHESFYSNGLFLAANSFSEEIDRIICIAPDSGAMGQVSYYEFYFSVPSKVFD